MVVSSRFLYAAAIALALPALGSCSKKDDAVPTAPPTLPAGLSWTVNRVPSTSTDLNMLARQGSSTVMIGGTIHTPGLVTYLSLEVPKAVGTYRFGPNSAAAATYCTNTGSVGAVYYAGALCGGTATGEGTIVVTAFTATNAQGTFTFTGINADNGNAKSVTNGTFNVQL